MAMINMTYLDHTHACLMCPSLDHITKNCKHGQELVPGSYIKEHSGRDIYARKYHSDSDD